MNHEPTKKGKTPDEIAVLLTFDDVPQNRIRVRRGRRWLVPDTNHWADWEDDDAIVAHGIRIGRASVDQVAEVLRETSIVAIWDTQADETLPRHVTYNEMYHHARQASVNAVNIPEWA